MEQLLWVLQSLNLNAIIDIFIVAMLFFGISFLFRGTVAVVLFRGMFILIVGLVLIANLLRLQALNWLLNNGLTMLAIAIPIIFQPELRRGLEQIGQGSLLFNRETPRDKRLHIINEICQAATRLSERRHGALIVLQRNISLEEYVRTGTRLNGHVTTELLLTIFWPKTELHDGAAIIDHNGRIASAASVLPLTASRNLPSRKMGTRHRASLGISEVSDAICVVVSEETGKIAITNGGRMVSRLDVERLRTILMALYGTEQERSTSPVAQLRSWSGRVRERVMDWRKDQQRA